MRLSLCVLFLRTLVLRDYEEKGPVDKLERNGFLYGILIISIARGRYL